MLAYLFLPLLLAQSSGTVDGTVTDSLSRAGLPAVAVSLTARGSKEPSRATMTDPSGAFRIEGLAPGDYEASYSKEGYFDSNASRSAHITPVGETVSLKAELVPLGGIGGRVLNPEGHPIAGVRVQLSTASRVSHEIRLIGMETGKDGSYRFQKMEPGAYMIEAVPTESGPKGGTAGAALKKETPLAPPSAPAGERRMWANTYYPNVLEHSQASRVVIHGGWELPGYDIALQAVPVYRVRGVVFAEDGRPAAGVSVDISRADRWEHDSDGTKTGDDGAFEFPAVPQGEWRLAAQGPGNLMGLAEAPVARLDLENVVVRLAAPFTFQGVVEAGAREVSAITLESATRAWSAGDSPSADGTFRIQNVHPDRYTINANGRPEGFYLASMRLGDREVMGQAVDLVPGLPPLRIIFKPATGRIKGTVGDGAGATVVLLPKEEALQNYQYIRSVKCDREGRFEIDSLKPGDYYAAAFAAPNMTALEDPEFIRTFSERTAHVQIDDSVAATVDLKLMPWPE